jgi:hypothetical protein
MSANTMTPPLADAAVENVIALMRTTRMPHARAVVAEVLATAKAQRWDPTEVVRVLLEAEATGRNASMLATRRKRAGFPTGKTFDVWDEASPPCRLQQRRSCGPWNGCGGGRT